MNDATIALVRKLKDNNGAYIWQPSAQAGVPDRLLGYEIYTSPCVPTVVAEALVIAFGDFSSYWIADRMGRSVQRFNELSYDETANAEADHTGEVEITEEEFICLSNDISERRDDSND